MGAGHRRHLARATTSKGCWHRSRTSAAPRKVRGCGAVPRGRGPACVGPHASRALGYPTSRSLTARFAANRAGTWTGEVKIDRTFDGA